MPGKLGLDPVGWYIVTLHRVLGHDTTARVMRYDGGRDACLICAYERHPSDTTRRAVIRALQPRPPEEP